MKAITRPRIFGRRRRRPDFASIRLRYADSSDLLTSPPPPSPRRGQPPDQRHAGQEYNHAGVDPDEPEQPLDPLRVGRDPPEEPGRRLVRPLGSAHLRPLTTPPWLDARTMMITTPASRITTSS